MELLNSTSKKISNHLVKHDGKDYHRVEVKRHDITVQVKWFSPTDLPIGKDTDLYASLEEAFTKMMLS